MEKEPSPEDTTSAKSLASDPTEPSSSAGVGKPMGTQNSAATVVDVEDLSSNDSPDTVDSSPPIRKMSNNFTKRHYRNSSGAAPDLDDSMDTDVFKAKTQSAATAASSSDLASCSTSKEANSLKALLGLGSSNSKTEDNMGGAETFPKSSSLREDELEDSTNFEDIAEFGLRPEANGEHEPTQNTSRSRNLENPSDVDVSDEEVDHRLLSSSDSSLDNIYDSMYLSESDDDDEEPSSDSSDSALDDLDIERKFTVYLRLVLKAYRLIFFNF